MPYGQRPADNQTRLVAPALQSETEIECESESMTKSRSRSPDQVQVPFPAAQLEYFKRKSPGFESRAVSIDDAVARMCPCGCGCGCVHVELGHSALWVQNLCCGLSTN